MNTVDKIFVTFLVFMFALLLVIIVCAVHSEFYGDPMTQALAARYGANR